MLSSVQAHSGCQSEHLRGDVEVEGDVQRGGAQLISMFTHRSVRRQRDDKIFSRRSEAFPEE